MIAPIDWIRQAERSRTPDGINFVTAHHFSELFPSLPPDENIMTSRIAYRERFNRLANTLFVICNADPYARLLPQNGRYC